MKDKRTLIRVVRNNDGEFAVDKTGKMSGRGAYLCADIKCFEAARKSKGFERSFKTAVPEEVYENLSLWFRENGK